MMNFPTTEVPTGVPTNNTREYAWENEIRYKAGKTPKNFAPNATPETVEAGFSYYDRENKQRVVLSTVSFYLTDIVRRVTGAVKAGDDYLNYDSNTVADSRNEPVQVYLRGAKSPQFSGLCTYDDAEKAYKVGGVALPQGVRPTMYFVGICRETGGAVAIEMTSTLQTAVKNAIAETTKTDKKRVYLDNLTTQSSEIWAFKFGPDFLRVDLEGNEYKGNADLYFTPKIQVGVVKKTAQTDDFFKQASDLSEKVMLRIVQGRKGESSQQEADYNPMDQLPADLSVPQPSIYERFPATAPTEPAQTEQTEPPVNYNVDDLPF